MQLWLLPPRIERQVKRVVLGINTIIKIELHGEIERLWHDELQPAQLQLTQARYFDLSMCVLVFLLLDHIVVVKVEQRAKLINHLELIAEEPAVFSGALWRNDSYI